MDAFAGTNTEISAKPIFVTTEESAIPTVQKAWNQIQHDDAQENQRERPQSVVDMDRTYPENIDLDRTPGQTVTVEDVTALPEPIQTAPEVEHLPTRRRRRRPARTETMHQDPTVNIELRNQLIAQIVAEVQDEEICEPSTTESKMLELMNWCIQN